jgi:hypothetical protein
MRGVGSAGSRRVAQASILLEWSMKAAQRLVRAEVQVTDPPNNNKDYTWQHKMDKGYKGKPRTPGQVLPEDTFSKSPSEIANLLKMHSTDYGQASSKLNSYINRQGKNLQGEDKSRLYDAKEHLKNAYGEHTETSASTEMPIYALPPGHNLDDPDLDTGFHPEELVKDGPMPTKLKAALRLASIYNTLEEPGTDTSLSSVVEADKWVNKVHPDHNAVPEGTFDKSAADIAKTLKRVSDSHGQASSRLNFYRNRGGKNVDQGKMDKAADILKGLYDE